MNYSIFKDKIEVYDKTQFNIEHILECGQIFTYEKLENNYIVYSQDKKAIIIENADKYIIKTSDVIYFKNFFDLETDYEKIKLSLSDFNFLKPMLKYGYGIRILKQSLIETTIGFIISANNNIGRIKKSMAFIRKNAGTKIDDFYAFPTLKQLRQCDEEFFISAGAGYRAKQIVEAIKEMTTINLESLRNLPSQELKRELVKMKGIGSKVADCILLFGYNRHDVFPVDTWIAKIYREYFNIKEENRDKMRAELINTFKNLSGYAQQYMFFYKRTCKMA